jgi:hypothetical protein
MENTSQVVSREVAVLKNGMVRRVEWRVGRIQERIGRARKALENSSPDEEPLESICSPPFTAGGVEGLQLQMYPMGYGGNSHGKCGFFLVAPRGVYIKCRAFIGDCVKNYEHHFDSREPYGRGSFCTLEDKAGSDDTVVCGIEILEVRQDLTRDIKAGPFGNVADQLKITLHPTVEGMDMVRELREIPENGAKEQRRGDRHRQTFASSFAGGAPMVAPPGALSRTSCSFGGAGPVAAPPGAMAASQSLPLLLPNVGSKTMSGGDCSTVWAAASPTIQPLRRGKGLPKI